MSVSILFSVSGGYVVQGLPVYQNSTILIVVGVGVGSKRRQLVKDHMRTSKESNWEWRGPFHRRMALRTT